LQKFGYSTGIKSPIPTPTEAPLPEPLPLPTPTGKMAPKNGTRTRNGKSKQRLKIPSSTLGTINRVVRQRPSTVQLAPISIGNTIRGQETQVVQSRDGCTLYGRDFMFTPIGTANIETWTLAGGAPLSPAAFQDSTLRQYMQMYNKFRFKTFTAHYLTSSPTSSDGDILFYYNKNRESVFLNQTSPNLLPFVISDPNTVLGPQWQNHSATFDVTSDWKSTDYGMTDDLQMYAAGDLFLLTRSTTTDSPGYVLFDYVIDFKEHSVIPRLLTLPLSRILWTNVAFINISAGTTINQGALFTPGGNTLSGSPSAAPSGSVFGDIYKVIFDRTNSTLGVGSTAFTVLNVPSNSVSVTSNITMNDGTTIYALHSSNGWTFYISLTAAMGGPGQLLWSSTQAVLAMTGQFWLSYVANASGVNVQPNF
jgi:hypothetical protein